MEYVEWSKEKSGLDIISALKSLDPKAWIIENKEVVEERLSQSGAILLRNFSIRSSSEFNQFVTAFCPNLLEYVYRSTPRTRLGGKIYTATQYPKSEIIPLHNENSYADVWPHKIIFMCVVPPSTGGETPLADSRKVIQRLPTDIVKKFTELGVMYVRNYMPGIDLSWQEVFQTDRKEDVNHYCELHNIEYVWNDGGAELTTKQRCPAVVRHPKTNERVWFNQAHLFHFSSLRSEIIQYLQAESDITGFPRNAYYGDGSVIEEETILQITHCYNEEKIIFPWQQGDLLILDNLLMAHGREAYSGDRKIIVAME